MQNDANFCARPFRMPLRTFPTINSASGITAVKRNTLLRLIIHSPAYDSIRQDGLGTAQLGRPTATFQAAKTLSIY